jgi:hypothetical protein
MLGDRSSSNLALRAQYMPGIALDAVNARTLFPLEALTISWNKKTHKNSPQY